MALMKTSLLNELKKFADSDKNARFDFSLIINDLPEEERELAFVLQRVMGRCQAAAEYDLMRYKLTGESLGIGYWDLTVTDGDSANPNNTLIWSSELRRMLGYTDSVSAASASSVSTSASADLVTAAPNAIPSAASDRSAIFAGDYTDTLGGWFKLIHPDDRKQAFSLFNEHVADRTGKTQLLTEYRLRKIDGDYISVRAYGTALRDGAGVPIRIAGAIEDVTEEKRMREKLLIRERTLDLLNRLAIALLSRGKDSFSDVMDGGFELIAKITKIDRMSVFRNTEKPDGLYLSQVYRWRKDANGTVDVWKELKDVPYSVMAPQLAPTLASGEYICGHADRLPGCEAFKKFGCETILAIPMIDNGVFWGAVLFERLCDENFSEQEIDVLRSASFMIANAVIRNEEATIVRQCNEQAQLMLDAAPLAVTMWDKNFSVIDCSQNALDVFGFSTKKDLTERLIQYAPEYQPCGRLSTDVLNEAAGEAFRTGSCRLEWTHSTTSGVPIVFEATAVRVFYRNEYALMLYSRDIREEKKMLADLVARDELLAAQAHWYKSLLDGIPVPIRVTDQDMKLTFTNTAAIDTFGGSRENLLGKPCDSLNCQICNTDDCSVARAKRGQKQTFIKIKDLSYKIDTEIIRDKDGNTLGYLEILHDVTEVESLARRSADDANEAKSVFLAQMSHEMRTPLSAVIGLSELLLENGGLSQGDEAYLDKIFNAGSTLLGIVNDILDISKIEAGKFEIIPQEYDVPGMINDTITQNILRIHSKPVSFALDISENAPTRLFGDDIRVKQILSNILSNAFKYTDKGEVSLRVDYERDADTVWTTFCVKDTGIGIKPADLDNLFADYTRFDSDANRKIGGTGLGLSITKRLVELMDGSIKAKSEYGKGTEITARIRQAFAGDGVIGVEMAERLKSFLYTTSKRRSGSQLRRVRIPYARVLVVDDNVTNLDIARGLMRPYGMDIDCMTGGQDAVDAIRDNEYKYAAVFMDHMMPGMDGVEATRIIREEIGSEYAKNVPIIALTANALAGNKEWFLSQGFNAFVSKPIDIFRLDEVIRRWIWDSDKERRMKDARVFADRRGRGRDRRKVADRRVGERRKDETISVNSEVIAGLDWTKGVELFGDEESYKQILHSFMVNTESGLEMARLISAETLSQYAIVVHGIKSAARGIGADGLGNVAESLEFAAKDGNLEYVNRNNPNFLASARALISDIETVLNKSKTKNAKPRKEKPDAVELERLRVACENYDMDEIEQVMLSIERFEYAADGGLAEWLRDNITKLNYAQVVERIDGFTRKERVAGYPT